MGPDIMILVFWMLSFKSTFTLFSLTFIRRFKKPYQTYNLSNEATYMKNGSTLFPVWNQSVVPCPILLLLPDLHADIIRGRSDGLLFPSLYEFSTVFVIYTFKGFIVVSEAEVDISLEFSCFFYDPVDVSNLISGFFAFSKPRCTNESSQFTYCRILAWRILNITSLTCEMCTTVIHTKALAYSMRKRKY